MRETSSSHTECIRTSRTAYTLQGGRAAFRPNLNVSLLADLLAGALPRTKQTGKRRASVSGLPAHRTKRAKTSRGSQDEENADSDSSGSLSLPPPQESLDYPSATTAKNPDQSQELQSILRHTFEIHFTKRNDDHPIKDPETLKSWDAADKILFDTIRTYSESISSTEVIDTTPNKLATWDEQAVIVLPKNERSEDNDWFFLVPCVSIDAEAYDFAEPQASDLMKACLLLQAATKLHLKTTLKAVVQPSTSSSTDDNILPLTLKLEIVASLPFPRTLDYEFPKRSIKKFITAIEDSQRRLLQTAFGDENISSDHASNAINVATFYSIMAPAPALPSDEAVRAMQPDVLKPNLLPFQCRSVAWLLSKEGMSVQPDGRIVPQTDTATFAFTFWKEVTIGNRILYINRLSGAIVDEKPEMPAVYGGMLAEEPGLGKTLETIGLVLLNPASPEWNPSLTRWDDVAKLDVKAVKSTLIVTPPSLVSQWRDELANHAPTLKVLVYDGWNKVGVPIVKTDRELERLAKLKLDDKKGKKKAVAKTKTKPKRRSKAKAKGKQPKPSIVDDDSDTDSMDVDSDSETDPNSAEKEPPEWPEYVHGYDVVITTYSILRTEIWVARPAPDRPRRDASMYTSMGRTRSPLVMVEWKRVVMDEVQMVGGGQAAEMVSLIPRLSSLAVSGTPAKAQMSDLIHVLKFLRIDQLVGSLQLWNRLLKPGFSTEFTAFLRHYGIRTAKSAVSNELTIPQQTRYLVGIDLGKVERHVYDQVLEVVLLDLGLDARGVAASEGWTVNGAALRNAIRRLRGICTHPQVGQLQRKGDTGLYKPGALKTMEAVLDTMREQNWRNMMDDWKSKIQLTIRAAQLAQHDKKDRNCYQTARDTLSGAEVDIRQKIHELEEALRALDVKGEELKAEAAIARRHRREALGENPVLQDNGKGKGKARDIEDDDETLEVDHVQDEEDRGLPKTPAGQEHKDRRSALKHRLRDAKVILHKVKFLQGDVHHVLGNSVDEDAGYQAAEVLRRELLKGNETEALRSIEILTDNAIERRLTEDELLIDVPYLKPSGLLSRDLVEELNEMLDNVLNGQSKLLWEWRSHILSILMKPLSSEDKDRVDGEEYQRTLDDQGEVETYMQAYSALLADRRQALVNERTLLAEHEIREKKKRKTKAAMKAAGTLQALLLGSDDEDDDELAMLQDENDEVQPEHAVLLKELSGQRQELLLPLNGRSVRSILVDISHVNSKIANEKHPEKAIAKEALAVIRDLIAQQTLMHEKLGHDLGLIRAAFNRRIQYFRQLQEISDSVAEVEWEGVTVAAAITVCQMEKAELENRINTTRARHRYLLNIAKAGDDSDDDEEDDDNACILCRCDFTRGFITHCAHIFCEGCIKMWVAKKEGKTCPVCRVAIDPNSLQRFTVDEEKEEAPRNPTAAEPIPQSRREVIYNRISPELVTSINDVETHGSFGSKIQFLIRHLHHIQIAEPGAKSIVFSAWADSLHIVEVALRTNGIRTLRIDQTTKGEHAAHKFRKDLEISVLLLHGERENAGLNITCASRVFLLESVVHHTFEVQAIARIDRLGQTRPTEVYCYYAEDTVERNILDLAARKGLSLYTKDNAVGTLNVSPFVDEGEQAIDDPSNLKHKAQQKGDFIYKMDDMLAILFPHMFEDLEYLLPPDNDVFMADVPVSSLGGQPRRGGIEVDAIAGPSRLSS